ncbi:hypothetical protein [Micromonospora cathayae]|uniref:Uncharacterized protein n=1 Tax=Micromonospora cathayae TaxID=3028804 RepID=A0ABY7ZX52_9ACTN|nr:hypothetical protein [Micromonospora sp. HUAS 3]WDZ87033.1 hypothetical protein PVK37_11830 [Micromonospora sp. HUAS 3]
MIRRAQQDIVRRTGVGGVAFAVRFQLLLTEEEHREASRYGFLDFLASWPERCPAGEQPCVTPRWTVGQLLAGVEFAPDQHGPATNTFTRLQKVQHAENDVLFGCNVFGKALRDARSHRGDEVIELPIPGTDV